MACFCCYWRRLDGCWRRIPCDGSASEGRPRRAGGNPAKVTVGAILATLFGVLVLLSLPATAA
ncbi:MAG: hypothetical protein NTY17_10395 [Planctomycetia bacterium]|nr:hypothetical protein [Planctomycetia bacterium]